MKAIALLLLLPQAALGQAYLSGEDFQSLTEGKTLYFSQAGRYYGAEQYLPNNKVRWQYPDGQCTEGYWFPQGQSLCFVYDDVPNALCWVMWDEAGRLLARPTQTPQDIPIELTRKDDLPLPCAAPDLGV